MQGKLSEIDIRSILQLVELGQRTGELFVEAYGSSETLLSARRRPAIEQSWFVFFLNGRIIYAGDSRGNLIRLRDHLRRYKRETALDSIGVGAIATLNAPEYGHLWALLETHVLTPAQGRSIIQSMVRETLFDLFTLHQGSFIFEVNSALSPQLTTLEITPLIASITKQVQEWKQFHPHIQTPDQCPILTDPEQLRSTLRETTFKTLEQWVDGKTSIRQIARYLSRDILTVARAIYPYVQQGWVQLVYPQSIAPAPFDAAADKIPHVVCIEDTLTVRKAVEAILQQHGYEATAIANPLEALSLVFQLKPDLILCDISMPELDGYEICAMLRTSTAFRQTPIVMLTGRDGFIDRVRARMVGATDYLTKPFGESELLMLVEKYVGVGQPQQLQSLSHSLAAELELEIDEAASAS
ncbi:MAG: response regulator [Microcoleus sp. SIO2G3]|nr:response regulator [Microcoleus sp. SIO2G3]